MVLEHGAQGGCERKGWWDVLRGQEPFTTDITAHDDTIVVELEGELDVVALPELENRLKTVLALQPRHVVIDISAAEFVSGSAFAAIGRCSNVIEHVTVWSASTLAERVLRILGYDDVECIRPAGDDQ